MCPDCGRPVVEKFGKHGLWFLSCSGWPECKAQQLDEHGEPLPEPEGTGEKCPECGEGELVAKSGRFGPFIGCSNYPKCKHIKKEPKAPPRRKPARIAPIAAPVGREARTFRPLRRVLQLPGVQIHLKKAKKLQGRAGRLLTSLLPHS